MVVHRVQLAEPPATVLSIAVRTRGTPLSLGIGMAEAPVELVVRYVTGDGRLQLHREWCRATAAPGCSLAVTGWLRAASDLTVSLEPTSSHVPPRPARGMLLTQRFTLPFLLETDVVTGLDALSLEPTVVCRTGPDGIMLRGAVRLCLRTPDGALSLRLPFCHLVRTVTLPPLCWRAQAAVCGLSVRVDDDGEIAGEVVLALRCEGAPQVAGFDSPAGAVALVREVRGAFQGITAEPVGGDQVLIEGAVDLDLYWVDREGRSRWTGRLLPFSALRPARGSLVGSRVEVAGHIARLTHRVEGDSVSVGLLLDLQITALRPSTVVLGAERYQLAQITAEGEDTLLLEERVVLEETARRQAAFRSESVSLSVPGLPGVWQALSLQISPASAQPGRWGATVLLQSGETIRWEQRLGGSLPAGDQGDALVGITALGGGVLTLQNQLRGGPALLPAAPAGGGRRAQATLPLPGPVRSIVALDLVEEGDGARARALVAGGGHLTLIQGAVPGQIKALLRATAVACAAPGGWHLALTLESAISAP